MEDKAADALPLIPRAHLTGLRSYIHRAYRTQWRSTAAVTNDVVTQESHVEMKSMDMDYHAHLRGRDAV